MNGRNRILADIIFLLLLALLCFSCSVGYTMTHTEMTESITIQTQQWNRLKTELTELNQELIDCQTELTMLKKPSTELVNELKSAQSMLNTLKQELELSKKDLMTLSNEAEELKISLKKLREQVNKERKVHKRQIWQNRFWCLLGGFAIGFAVQK